MLFNNFFTFFASLFDFSTVQNRKLKFSFSFEFSDIKNLLLANIHDDTVKYCASAIWMKWVFCLNEINQLWGACQMCINIIYLALVNALSGTTFQSAQSS